MGRKSADGQVSGVLGRAVSHLRGEPKKRFTLRGVHSWLWAGDTLEGIPVRNWPRVRALPAKREP